MWNLIFRAALIGPAIGTLSVFIPALPEAPQTGPIDYAMLPAGFVIAFAGVYIFAFLMGSLPAMLTGIAYWCILNFATRQNPAWPIRTAIGGITGAVVYLACSSVIPMLRADFLRVGDMPLLPGISFVAGAMVAASVSQATYAEIFLYREQGGQP